VGPGNKVQLRAVTAGRNLGTEIEIISGIALSDRVLDTPPDSIAAGDLVQPLEPGKQGPPTQPGQERVVRGSSGESERERQ
jgi:membrane fusion protein, multidrug efflux system